MSSISQIESGELLEEESPPMSENLMWDKINQTREEMVEIRTTVGHMGSTVNEIKDELRQHKENSNRQHQEQLQKAESTERAVGEVKTIMLDHIKSVNETRKRREAEEAEEKRKREAEEAEERRLRALEESQMRVFERKAEFWKSKKGIGIIIAVVGAVAATLAKMGFLG